MTDALRALRPSAADGACAGLETAITYLEGQRTWLGHCAAWRTAGHPLGRGPIERAGALVINQRLKRRGMRWRHFTAAAVVALRVRELNGTWDNTVAPSPLAV